MNSAAPMITMTVTMIPTVTIETKTINQNTGLLKIRGLRQFKGEKYYG